MDGFLRVMFGENVIIFGVRSARCTSYIVTSLSSFELFGMHLKTKTFWLGM